MKPWHFLAQSLLLFSVALGEEAVPCHKNISFAVAEGGQTVSRTPSFAAKWIGKNEKKYAGLCFSQVPRPNALNYLIVFSTSQSAFNGIYPTVQTTKTIDTSPVSGSGTLSTNYGQTWQYTYNGTITTTTTTTSQVDLPYRDTTTGMFANVYNEHGDLLARLSRAITTRQGGEAYNTLGYNLGSMLASIHLKEGLLKAAVKDVMR